MRISKGVAKISLFLFVLTFMLFFLIFSSSLRAEDVLASDSGQIVQRTLTSKTICDGKECIAELSGVINYWNGTAYIPINRTILPDPKSEPLYNYGTETGIYSAYFKTNPSIAETIKFYFNDSKMYGDSTKVGEINYQPMSINYRNHFSMIQQISMVQSVEGEVRGNTFVYPNAFGHGINLTYSYGNTMLRAILEIESLSDLPIPESYIEAGHGENITLDFDSIASWDVNSIPTIDDSIIDTKDEIKTSRNLEFKTEVGKDLFFLPTPIAWDSAGNVIRGTLTIKESGNKIYFIKSFPHWWLL